MNNIRIITLTLAVLALAATLTFFFFEALSTSTAGVSEEDEYYMQLAFEEAELALESGDAPVGAIVVVDGDILGRAHNDVHTHNEHTHHAEILAISQALDTLGIDTFYKYPGDVTLYVTYEPDAMCEGFITHKHVQNVVIGENKALHRDIGDKYAPYLRFKINSRSGVLAHVHHELFALR